MKIVIVFGTRSEFIKLAPFIKLCAMRGVEHEVYLSGQHRELLAGLPDLFEINNIKTLDLPRSAAKLPHITGNIIRAVDEQVLNKSHWDAVVIQGDTVTAMATAMAAFYHQVPVAHIEAGLRTFNLNKPFPEEMNRQVIAKLSHWHFCPTPRAKSNLLREGISPAQIELCGNTAVDSTLYILKSKINFDYGQNGLVSESPQLYQALNAYVANNGQTLSLMTLHRRENLTDRLAHFLLGLKQWLLSHPDHHMLFPYHLNPMVKDMAFKYLDGIANLHLIAPLNYRAMLYALSRCDFALSDSGGIQEEMPSLQKPLLILRDVTERPEILEKGLARAVGLNPQTVLNECDILISALKNKRLPSWYRPNQTNPFGDGFSAQRILERLTKDLSQTKSSLAS